MMRVCRIEDFASWQEIQGMQNRASEGFRHIQVRSQLRNQLHTCTWAWFRLR